MSRGLGDVYKRQGFEEDKLFGKCPLSGRAEREKQRRKWLEDRGRDCTCLQAATEI